MFARIFNRKGLVGIAVAAAGAGTVYGMWNGSKLLDSRTVVHAASTPHRDGSQTKRQARFDKFASCAIDDQYLMTPADFLESLMHHNLPGKYYVQLIFVITKARLN